MNRRASLFLIGAFLLAGCGSLFRSSNGPGTAWGSGTFHSNGEQIYFTSIDERGVRISYSGGPDMSGMMMGGYLACVSCHSLDARGGIHMMAMEVMDAPDIRWSALAAHEAEEENLPPDQASYDLATFRTAVVEGQHPDGDLLDEDMPRWSMDDQDLADLADYLQSLP
jgi:cytochrome c oxidase subunit 2